MKDFFKNLRKKVIHGWRRGGNVRGIEFWSGNNSARWLDEELSNDMFLNFAGVLGMTGVDIEPRHEKAAKAKAEERIEKKPKEVFEELTADTPNLDLTELPAKIKAMQRRVDFMKEELGLVATEEKNVLSWLKAREKGLKVGVMKDFDWPVTTTTKISALLKKYKLTRASLNQYSLAIPEEAIDEMEKYMNLWKKVVDKKDGDPEFLLIVPDTEEFRKKKRDPILLATSPFGKFLHVLGAWDKEVEIMHELYFENK